MTNQKKAYVAPQVEKLDFDFTNAVAASATEITGTTYKKKDGCTIYHNQGNCKRN